MRYLRTCADCGQTQEMGNPPQSLICPPCARFPIWQRNVAAQADVDQAAVQRLLSGSRVRSTRAERQEATVTLTRRGLTAWQIARHLDVSERTIQRLRARVRVA